MVPRPWVDDSGLVSHRRASGSRPGAPEALDGVRQVGGVVSGFLGCRGGPPLHLRKQGAGVGLVELLHRVCGSGLLCRASDDASEARRRRLFDSPSFPMGFLNKRKITVQ